MFFKRKEKPPVCSDSRCCNHVCKAREWSPEASHASYGDLTKVPFDEALNRIDQLIDDMGICMNEITKDREAWAVVAMMGMVGNKLNNLRQEGGKPAMHAYIDSLPD